MDKKDVDCSTEEKIVIAACKLFTQKGFFATRTREIADEAGINLALLNYYFGSKENLFNIVMEQRMVAFWKIMTPFFNDETIPLEEKIKILVEEFTDLLLEQPDLPIFILSEMRQHSKLFANKIKTHMGLINSNLLEQIKARKPDLDPFQFIMSLLGMLYFPFLAKPIFQDISNTEDEDIECLLEERKKLIPVWMEQILQQ